MRIGIRILLLTAFAAVLFPLLAMSARGAVSAAPSPQNAGEGAAVAITEVRDAARTESPSQATGDCRKLKQRAAVQVALQSAGITLLFTALVTGVCLLCRHMHYRRIRNWLRQME